MLFNTVQFALFFLVVLALHRAAPRAWRGGVLFGASLLFYFLWIPPYLLLLLGDIGVNYLLVRGIQRGRRPRLFLTASVVFSLGVLAWFKYAGFLAGVVSPLTGAAFGETLPVPDILLPLGISFFTFQMIALSVDTYRRTVEPVRSFREYALFVSFFPQLIAGPILRGSQLLPQIRRGGVTTPERTRRGLWLLASGLAKKVILADFLLAPFVDRIFLDPGGASAPVHLIALYSFAFQIYCDFSGYTDIARGLGLLLGFELPKNFLEPYLSRNPAEFWRRWHITLSTWLRDYLYVPLGGNRRGVPRLYVNLGITMTLGGLWHGAGWNFLIWGALHGLLLVVHRLTGGRPDEGRPVTWRDLPSIVGLFHAVCFLWIFFRTPGPEEALRYITALLTGSYLEPWPVLQTGVVALAAIAHVAERGLRPALPAIRERLGGLPGATLEGAVLGAVAALAFWLGGAGGEFIYFQF